jgi:hypothetical protein
MSLVCATLMPVVGGLKATAPSVTIDIGTPFTISPPMLRKQPIAAP